jgi:hypothetical protein
MDTLADERIEGRVVAAGTGLRLNAPPAIGRNPYFGGLVKTADVYFDERDVESYLHVFDVPVNSQLTTWLTGRPGFVASFVTAVLQKPRLENGPRNCRGSKSVW